GDGELVWASELRAIREFLPAEKLSLDAEALLDFLVYRYIPAPKTLYRNVFKLPAASVLVCNLDDLTIRVHRYWRLQTDVQETSDRLLASRLLELLDTSVSEQLISDVPLGLLLSGGIDSSCIASRA